MPSTNLPNAITSAIAKAVKTELARHGVEARHSHILSGIAHGLGFASANAMRALAPDARDRIGRPAPDKGKVAGYRTSFLVEVLSHEDDVSGNEIETVLYRMNEGDCVGFVTEIDVTPLTRAVLSDECDRMGSDIGFFTDDLDEDADEPETQRRPGYGDLLAALGNLCREILEQQAQDPVTALRDEEQEALDVAEEIVGSGADDDRTDYDALLGALDRLRTLTRRRLADPGDPVAERLAREALPSLETALRLVARTQEGDGA